MLHSLSQIFKGLTADDVWLDYSGRVVAIGSFFLFQFTVGVLVLSSLSATPKAKASEV